MRCGYGRATLTFDSDNDAAPARINKRLTLLIGMMRPIAVPNEEAECTSLCKCEEETRDPSTGMAWMAMF